MRRRSRHRLSPSGPWRRRAQSWMRWFRKLRVAANILLIVGAAVPAAMLNRGRDDRSYINLRNRHGVEQLFGGRRRRTAFVCGFQAQAMTDHAWQHGLQILRNHAAAAHEQRPGLGRVLERSEEHTSELQSPKD